MKDLRTIIIKFVSIKKYLFPFMRLPSDDQVGNFDQSLTFCKQSFKIGTVSLFNHLVLKSEGNRIYLRMGELYENKIDY